MLTSSIEDVRVERAKFARDVEYLKETALDDMIDERTEIVDSMYRVEKMEELQEAADMVKKLPADEDLVEESAELDRILNAKDNITFEEMIGIN